MKVFEIIEYQARHYGITMSMKDHIFAGIYPIHFHADEWRNGKALAPPVVYEQFGEFICSVIDSGQRWKIVDRKWFS